MFCLYDNNGAKRFKGWVVLNEFITIFYELDL